MRGALADASVALLVASLLGILLRTRTWPGRLLALVVLMVFLLATFAMYEFISVFDSLYALSHAGFLGDATFLGGSVGHVRHPFMLLLAAGTGALSVLRACAPGADWWRWWGLAFAASVLGQLLIPLSYAHDEWRQRHAIQANLEVLPATRAPGEGPVSSELRAAFRADTDGTRWVGSLSGRPNVLLILVEAASGAYLPSVAKTQDVHEQTVMPRLDALAHEHVLLTNVISQQRQTNRSEYGILCGDYPKLLTDQSKMSEQVYGEARRCLPEALRDAGYATAYIQSAPLGFMLKDQFMKKAGFEELIGDPWFEQSYARTDWGVDDKAFFEQSLERVVELHEDEEPFFVTMLTVGTHHPYTFPDTAVFEGAETRRERAFRWADDALAGFLERLRHRGVLDDTVVIVTSDESAGLSKAADSTQRLLSQSWSFSIVMLPEPVAKRIDTPYAHVDTALSVLDLLGLDRDAETFLGRSWFRDYQTPRRLFSGNTYARRVIMWEPSGAALVCDESFRRCSRSIPSAGARFGPTRQSGPVDGRERQLLGEVARLSRSGRPDLGRVGELELIDQRELSVPAVDGKKLLIGGQYLRVPAGATLRVDFDLEVVGEESLVELHQDVFLNGREKFARKGFRLRNDERWRLQYEISVPRNSSHLVVQLYATTVSGEKARIRVRDARLTMTEGNSSAERTVVIRDEVVRRAPP